MSLFAELKRRNVIRMAGLYLVAAWLVVQVAETLLPLYDTPAWVLKTIVLLLAIGFVPALVFAWVFEVTPEGVKRDEDVVPGQSIAPQTARRMDRMIMLVLALALGYFAVDKFVIQRHADESAAAEARAPAVAGDDAGKTARNPLSIAVLAFVNLSNEPENEFFADGVSEEILNSLARIDGMQVVGRTSSFQFKGKNEDLRSIGEKLSVANVLEGSVRREGERARITAQLVRTSDGIHLWSQTYDRTLEDTLAVQLDIAEQVAGVLEVVLDDTQRKRMRDAGVKNVDAFVAYQKGLRLYADAHSRPGADFFATMRQANQEFARATALDPDFSLAHFAAADLFEHSLLRDSGSHEERAAAQRDALKTLDLAAATSKDEQQRLLTQAERQMLSDDWRGLSTRIGAAFKAPGCHASNWLQVFASAFGNADLLEDFGARVSVCDPLNFINFNSRATVALANGNPDRVLRILAASEQARGGAARPSVDRALALVMQGNVDAARRQLETGGQNNENAAIAGIIVDRAAGVAPALTRERLQGMDRSGSRYQQWDFVDAVAAVHAGDRAEANRRAAQLDARPGGGLLLAWLAVTCQCGAPFDVEATPNFRARLAESGLAWPPAASIRFPPAPQETTP